MTQVSGGQGTLEKALLLLLLLQTEKARERMRKIIGGSFFACKVESLAGLAIHGYTGTRLYRGW